MQTEIIVRTERTPTLNMILMIIRSGIFWVQDTFRWTLTLLKYTVLRGAVFLFAVILLLWLSIFLYASFYYMYMPAESHVKPVHFTFRVCESGAGLCSFPSANISLLKDNKDEILARGQLYRIMLELDLPESPTNQYLGMFMVSFKMYDKNKDVVQTSKRSAMLRYRSSLLQILETFVFSPMFLAGIHEQRQVLPVELFSSYVDNPYKPTVGALIEIENQKIEFYSASLRIYANFSGLRYLMFNWPTVCAVFGIGTNMFFLSAIAILSWYQFYCSDTPALQFGDNLEFRENMSLEERRKKIRAVLEQEKQNQERLPIPTKSRKKPSNIDKGVKYRTSSAANPTTETLGAGSSTHHDDDSSSKESSPDTNENMAEEETLLLSIQASDIETEDGHEGELRHRHPKH